MKQKPNQYPRLIGNKPGEVGGVSKKKAERARKRFAKMIKRCNQREQDESEPLAISCVYRVRKIVKRMFDDESSIEITESILENMITGETLTIRGDPPRKLNEVVILVEQLK